MERCAVFVDAGWFLTEAAQAIAGRGSRRSIECDYPQLTAALGHLGQQLTQLPLLRIYWYDAAADGIPTSEHLDIARLRDVKLRLGRISHNQQKGVDALLILDLTTLARERAIASALVISGDEDIREGIASAQTLGVRVTIGGLAVAEGRPSLATTLLNEADDQILIDLGFLSRYVRAVPQELPRPHPAAPVLVPSGAAQAASVPSAAPAQPELDPSPEPASEPDASSGTPNRGQAWEPRRFGYDFGEAYANNLNDPQLRTLQRSAPEIPADIAAQLFREAETVFGETRGRPELRRELRMGFWDHIMQRRNT